MVFLALFIIALIIILMFLKLSFMLTISFDDKGFDMEVKVMLYRILTIYKWNFKEGGLSFLASRKKDVPDEHKKKKGRLSGVLKTMFSEDTMRHLRKNMEIFDISVKGRLASQNAAFTALAYGSIWSVLGALIPYIPQKRLFLDFYPDFQKDTPDFHVTCILRVRISHIIVLMTDYFREKLRKGRIKSYGTASN
ncbi:MAG: DUF2953 domain-containing protein [Clostridiaceae bacterium]|nr:DUF2953 domain-containing protein [Clostridiaceae bacterium]